MDIKHFRSRMHVPLKKMKRARKSHFFKLRNGLIFPGVTNFIELKNSGWFDLYASRNVQPASIQLRVVSADFLISWLNFVELCGSFGVSYPAIVSLSKCSLADWKRSIMSKIASSTLTINYTVGKSRSLFVEHAVVNVHVVLQFFIAATICDVWHLQPHIRDVFGNCEMCNSFTISIWGFR